MMNLFARILSHGFGLIIVALLVIALIYRGKLFPEWELPDFLALDSASEQPAETASGDVMRSGEADEPSEMPAVTEDQEAVVPGEDVTAAVDEEAPTDETVAADAAAPAEPVTEPQPIATEQVEAGADSEQAVADSAGAADTASAPEEPATVAVETEAPEPEAMEPVVQEPEAMEPVVQEPEAMEPEAPEPEAMEPEAPEPEAMEPVVQELEAVEPDSDAVPETTTDSAQATIAEQADVAPSVAPESSPYQVLAAAREAYWLRDYERAEQMYKNLIALEPDNPDGYGELGNMYFSQGNWEDASAAYYDAGTRLADQGFLNDARQMVEVIRGLKGNQADSLEQKIQSLEQ